MHYAALIPALVAIYLLRKIGLIKTFLYFFVPLMVFVPDYYKARISGLPDVSMIQGAIFPIAIATILQFHKNWRFRFMDVLVCTLAAIAVISEYKAAGYADAQNYIVDMLCYIVLPYFIGRLLIEQNDLRLLVAKHIVLTAVVVIFLMAYEWRFAVNPYQKYLSMIFAGQGGGWGITFRFGMPRAAGPYAHALLAGIMFAIYYRLFRWVMWQKGWPEKFPWYPNHPFTFTFILFGIIAFGVFCNGAKGAWLGAAVAAVIVTAGRVKFRKLYLRILLVFSIIVVVPMVIDFWSYASVGRANAVDDNQETAAYRKELIDHYWVLAVDHADWGWGKNKVPKIPGSESVDNYFLLLCLMHGIYAGAILVMIFLAMIFRLWRRANRESDTYPDSDGFAWTLLGIFIMYLIALATVFMAFQIMLFFYLFVGWAETYLQRGIIRAGPSLANGSAQSSASSKHRFRRVLI